VLAPESHRGFSPGQRQRAPRSRRDLRPGAQGLTPPSVPLVIGADFGHTEPRHVIPSGGTVTVDGGTRQILVTY